jgi:hypothetical protein
MGLTLKVIEAPVYGVVVFMAAMTTIVAPPLLNIAFRGAVPQPVEERFGLG